MSDKYRIEKVLQAYLDTEPPGLSPRESDDEWVIAHLLYELELWASQTKGRVDFDKARATAKSWTANRAAMDKINKMLVWNKPPVQE